MSTVADGLPVINVPETTENNINLMNEDIFILDGADLLDTLLLTNECVGCHFCRLLHMHKYLLNVNMIICLGEGNFLEK